MTTAVKRVSAGTMSRAVLQRVEVLCRRKCMAKSDRRDQRLRWSNCWSSSPLLAFDCTAIACRASSARSCQAFAMSKQFEATGLAAQSHLNAQKAFPSGGWGWNWVGDPDRGFGINQPGGWATRYCHLLKSGAFVKSARELRRQQRNMRLLRQMLVVPSPTFVCPSRRGATIGPIGDYRIWNLDTTSPPMPPLGSRNDYAGNAGTDHTGCCDVEGGTNGGNGGPPTGTDQNSAFDIAAYFRGKKYWNKSTGVIYGGSSISVKKNTGRAHEDLFARREVAVAPVLRSARKSRRNTEMWATTRQCIRGTIKILFVGAEIRELSTRRRSAQRRSTCRCTMRIIFPVAIRTVAGEWEVLEAPIRRLVFL